nr:MAG TPA: hypothetical protein [Caudoviricetes sp.]
MRNLSKIKKKSDHLSQIFLKILERSFVISEY